MKWINTHYIQMNWSSIKGSFSCRYLFNKTKHRGWQSDTSLNKKMSYFCLQESPVEKTHICYCWACHAAWRGSFSNIFSSFNEYRFSNKTKIKLSLLGGKNLRFFFLPCVLVFICWDFWSFLCLGNLDSKSKLE